MCFRDIKRDFHPETNGSVSMLVLALSRHSREWIHTRLRIARVPD